MRFPNKVLQFRHPDEIFPQSCNPDAYYRLITIPTVILFINEEGPLFIGCTFPHSTSVKVFARRGQDFFPLICQGLAHGNDN